MKLKNLLENMEILELHADPDALITGISYDSRKTREGDLFVAVSGLQTDGHRFIPAAAASGARAVLCTIRPETEIPYILVPDCRKALAAASAAFYGHPTSRLKVIGVTGTNGKTTTTNLIRHILQEQGHTVGLIGTNGNYIGDTYLHTEHTTPESLELQEMFLHMAQAGCDYAVMEVSSHSLAMSRVDGIHFQAGVFTNLTRDHLDFHGTMEAYGEAKRELFSMCETACINRDDPWYDFMSGNLVCREIRYGIGDGEEGDLTANGLELTAAGVRFEVSWKGRTYPASLAIPGKFSVYNALSAISALLACGLEIESILACLATARGVKGRVENVPTEGDYHVIIDYSHTPDALENALLTLRPVTRGRLICLFGCGGDRDRTKRPMMGKIAWENSDLVIVTSDNPRTEEPQDIINHICAGIPAEVGNDRLLVICDRIEAIHHAVNLALPGDVILLAGKGHEDYQVIGTQKIHMDEREIVADAIEERKTRRTES